MMPVVYSGARRKFVSLGKCSLKCAISRNMRVFHLLVPAIFSFTASAADALLDPATLKLIPQRMQELVDKRELSGVITLVARNNQIAELDASALPTSKIANRCGPTASCRSCRRQKQSPAWRR